MKPPTRRAAARQARTALLLIDVINDLDFPAADALLKQALPMAARLRRLAERCRRQGVPVVYVNDNFGRWRSDFRAVIAHCLDENSRGRGVVEKLLPQKEDYFVLKPLHSGFYSTTLDVLLSHLHADTLILTGIAAEICVLFTANDAYMRGFKLMVPRDCVASADPGDRRRALAQMSSLLKADTRPSADLRIPRQQGR